MHRVPKLFDKRSQITPARTRGIIQASFKSTQWSGRPVVIIQALCTARSTSAEFNVSASRWGLPPWLLGQQLRQ
jgi:hypothetical protein